MENHTPIHHQTNQSIIWPKVEVTIDWSEIRSLIEEKRGLTVIEEDHDCEHSGDPDRGDYTELLRSVTCVCEVEEAKYLKRRRGETLTD